MKWMWRGICLAVFASPTYLVRFHVAGIPTTLFEIIVWVLVCGTVVRAIADTTARAAYAQKITRIPWVLTSTTIIFVIAGIISVGVAPDRNAALGIFKAYIIDAIAFGLVTWLHLESREQFKQLAAVFSVTAGTVAVVGIVQKVTGWGIPNPFWRAAATRRVTAMFGYPNAVGLYLELALPWLAGWFLITKSVAMRAWIGFVALCSLLAIVFAQSSGTAAALVVTSGLWLIIWRRTRWPAIVCAVLCVISVAVTSVRGEFADEFLLQGVSGRIRTQMWKETVQMLRVRPVVGAGLAGYQARVAPYHVNKKVEIYLYPHNLVLTLWSELGLLGLVSFASIFALLCVWNVHILRKKTAHFEMKVWAGVVISLCCIIFVHGLVDIPYFKNDFSALFWLTVAASLWLRYNQTSQSL